MAVRENHQVSDIHKSSIFCKDRMQHSIYSCLEKYVQIVAKTQSYIVLNKKFRTIAHVTWIQIII